METILDKKNNIIGKILNSTDINHIEYLISAKKTYWKKPLTEKDKKILIENYQLKLNNSNFCCLGVFKDNQLILESSSFYPIKFPYWYNLSYMGDLAKLELNPFYLEYISSLFIYNTFIEKAENMKYFSYFTIRPENHQRFANRKFYKNKFSPESHLSRYISLFEYCYEPNEECKFTSHEIFFKSFKTFDQKAYVHLQCLKPEFRPYCK
jgi:hypothetical protein